MEHRVITNRETQLCQQNLSDLAAFWKFATKKCKQCGYPLSGLIEHNYSMSAEGSVCELCHAMEFAIRGKKVLEAAQAEYKDEQKKKAKMLEKDGKDYFSR